MNGSDIKMVDLKTDILVIERCHFNYWKSSYGLGGVVFKMKSKMIYSTSRGFFNHVEEEMLFTY